MSISDLTYSTLGTSCYVSNISSKRGFIPVRGLLPSSTYIGQLRKNVKLSVHSESKLRKYLMQLHPFERNGKIRSAMNASYGDMSEDSTDVFPRIHIKDPYKRLGISREASEEEIQAARNFLISKYAGHKPSVDAIEEAHDRIIMQSFYDRRRPKINIKKKVREITQSRVIKAVGSRFQTPSTKVIMKTAIAFLVLGALTILFPTEEGPTLQVAISLIISIYFIRERLGSKIRAFLYGIGAFFGSWLLGTFLMVSVVPPLPLLRGPRSFEVTTSLISYILLWVSSTYLK